MTGQMGLLPLTEASMRGSDEPRVVLSRSPQETQALGVELGRRVTPGDVILLQGGLGSGKTCFTQGIAQGLEVSDVVQSPTFVFINEYRGRLPLYHIDLYRSEGLAEVADLGLDDYLYADGVCVVEWAERGTGVFPLDHLTVNLEILGDNVRRLTLIPDTPRFAELIRTLGEPSP